MKQRQYRRCHSIPMFIKTPCIKTVIKNRLGGKFLFYFTGLQSHFLMTNKDITDNKDYHYNLHIHKILKC